MSFIQPWFQSGGGGGGSGSGGDINNLWQLDFCPSFIQRFIALNDVRLSRYTDSIWHQIHTCVAWRTRRPTDHLPLFSHTQHCPGFTPTLPATFITLLSCPFFNFNRTEKKKESSLVMNFYHARCFVFLYRKCNLCFAGIFQQLRDLISELHQFQMRHHI